MRGARRYALARTHVDIETFLQFKNTPLRAEPSGGNSTTAITLDTNGTASVTNNVALGTGHIKAIVDTMKERNIAPFTADDYVSVSHPSTFRNTKNSLETIKCGGLAA